MTALPRLALWILEELLDEETLESILGDLEEIRGQELRLSGTIRAGFWFWGQTLWILPFAIRQRLRRRNPQSKGDRFMRLWLRDLKYSLRSLIRQPRFSVAAILTIALGIGANTATFTLLDGFLLRPLAVEEPERLVRVYGVNERSGDFSGGFSYPTLLDLNREAQTLKGLTGRNLGKASIDFGSDTDLLFGEVVMGNYFDVLGVRPALGRGFLAEEYQTGSPVVVISQRLFHERFRADPSTLGKKIRVNSEPFTIVGVAPSDFHGTKFALSVDFWLPLRSSSLPPGQLEDRGSFWLPAIARLADDQDITSAQAELDLLYRQIAEADPAERQETGIHLREATGLALDTPPDVTDVATMAGGLAMVLVALILLIACANVASLMTARSTERQRDIGIRLALGASRGRVLRFLLTESLAVALLGGSAGVLLSFWAVPYMRLLYPVIPYRIHFDLSPNLQVLAFAAVVSLGTGIAFGLLPALRAGKVDLVSSLRSVLQAGEGRKSRFARALVISQVAVSLLLLVITGLFVQSLGHLETASPGFPANKVLFASIDLHLAGYDRENGRAAIGRIEQRLAALPGVESVGLSDNVPLDDAGNRTTVWKEGFEMQQDEGVEAEIAVVSDDYFEALGVPLLEGRSFDASETLDSDRLVIVNQELARRLWGTVSPLGKRLSMGDNSYAVVGVVPTFKSRSITEDDYGAMFFSSRQFYEPAITVVLKTSLPPAQLGQDVRRVVREFDPAVPVYAVRTGAQQMSLTLWPHRFGASLSTVFGFLALLLASVGLYGLVSYSVSCRTSEFGIRMALGATGRDVLLLILKSGGALIAAGTLIGLGGVVIASRFLQSLVFGVGAADPVTIIAGAVSLAAIALLACYLPARRASRTDPMQSLRIE